jgi:hypothetical protein
MALEWLACLRAVFTREIEGARYELSISFLNTFFHVFEHLSSYKSRRVKVYCICSGELASIQ